MFNFKRKVYYFAYGSNMSQERLEKRVGKVKKIGVGLLEEYDLSFNYGNDNFSFANVKAGTKGVLGVIYQLTEDQLDILDVYEGEGIPKYYIRCKDLIGNKVVNFYISFNTREEFAKPISRDYYNTLVVGCKENNIINEISEVNSTHISEADYMCS